MGSHKTSRHVKANARTLSYAIRQYFRPALREISSLTGQPEVAAAAALPPVQRAASLPTPDDQLIPTQPECSTSSAVIAPVPSEKSLGKRKRVEDDHQQDNTPRTSSSVQTRFTQSNIPPALKKCELAYAIPCGSVPRLTPKLKRLFTRYADWHQRYRLFSRYDEGIQMDYDGEMRRLILINSSMYSV